MQHKVLLPSNRVFKRTSDSRIHWELDGLLIIHWWRVQQGITRLIKDYENSNKNGYLKRIFLKCQSHFDFCPAFHLRPSWKWPAFLMDIGKIKCKGEIATYVLICSYFALSHRREGSTVSRHVNIFKCFHSSNFQMLRNNFMTAVLWNIPAVTTSRCPGSNSEVKFEMWYH